MRIEVQSPIALSYRIVRTGLNKSNEANEDQNQTFLSLVPSVRPDFPQLSTLNHQLFDMKSFTEHLWLDVPGRRGFINITPKIDELVHRSGVMEGLCLVNAMHITASVFINDDEPGLHHDYELWLEKLAPHAPTSTYQHNRTGEDNADAHLKRQIIGREVVVAITKGKLDFGPWEQIFYGEFRRPKKKASAGQDNRRLTASDH